jgi:hypothetical protein
MLGAAVETEKEDLRKSQFFAIRNDLVIDIAEVKYVSNRGISPLGIRRLGPSVTAFALRRRVSCCVIIFPPRP